MKITKKNITAAEEVEEKEKSLEDIVEEKYGELEENFDYFLAGIDKLCREDRCQEAISILDSVAGTLEQSISQVSDLFAEAPLEDKEV